MRSKNHDLYKENYDMRKKISKMKNCFNEIKSLLYCIGGPLNDNYFGYTKKQLDVFFRIAAICEE